VVNTLVTPGNLSGFPGAPFAETVLDAAVATVREEAGWHIAPVITETVTLDGPASGILMLPTRRVTAILSVTDDGVLVDPTEFYLREGGYLQRRYSRWGGRKMTVEFTHGFDACPDTLLPIIAERARTLARGGVVRQESLGSRSVSFGKEATSAVPPRLVAL
jgi:hypothetical protein